MGGLMSGRAWGVLLLTAAILALVMGAAIAGHTITGTPQVEPPPGPPGVGDCLTQPVPEHGGLSWDSVADQASARPTVLPRELPEGVFAPCRASRFGEVVDVDPNPLAATAIQTAAGISVSDPAWTRCADSAARYLGLDEPGTQIWQPDFGSSIVLVGPTQRQRAFGQHWSACVLVVPADGMTPALDRSPRALLATGDTRDELGDCQTNASWATGSAGLGTCGQPHRSETFAYAEFGSAAVPSREQLAVSCLQLIRRTTGLPDSALGSLFAGVHVFDDGSLLDIGREPTPDSVVLCGVSSTVTAALNHSLIAWGNHPLPLA